MKYSMNYFSTFPIEKQEQASEILRDLKIYHSWKESEIKMHTLPGYDLYLKDDVIHDDVRWALEDLEDHDDFDDCEEPQMKTYYFTFDHVHFHPKTGVYLKEYYVKFQALNYEFAKYAMTRYFGLKWSHQYDQQPSADFYPAGEYKLHL